MTEQNVAPAAKDSSKGSGHGGCGCGCGKNKRTQNGTGRYQRMFARLEERGEKAFIPFLMLGDPTPQASLELIQAVIAGGADALELGIGFSDPVADGPVIARAHLRAMENGPVTDAAISLIAQIRAVYPEIPIGMLLYANMAFRQDQATEGDEGEATQAAGVDSGEESPRFPLISRLAAAGVDSILVADCPLREGEPLRQACQAAGVEPVFIAPPGADEATLAAVTRLSTAYVYVLSRAGVTGTHESPSATALPERVAQLRAASPADAPTRLVQGFGVRSPEDVAAGVAVGMDGVIAGSALVQLVEENLSDQGFALDKAKAQLQDAVKAFKAATRKAE